MVNLAGSRTLVSGASAARRAALDPPEEDALVDAAAVELERRAAPVELGDSMALDAPAAVEDRLEC
jgi:hypothetical protein